MKLFAYIFLFLFSSSFGFQETQSSWSNEEKAKANTAKNVSYLDTTEIQIIYYLNLARLYPKKFAQIEVQDYYLNNNLKNSSYKRSLLSELKSMQPVNALQPKQDMSINANCLQLEQAKSGEMGHKRKKCEKENYAECCAYGSKTAREVIVDLLIDLNISNLGHRKICLDPQYNFIGVAHGKHKNYGVSSVLEFY